ncbi:MAG: hypothetical protein J7L16_08955 [Deltaproteobacteria bacterium]|nr:hypothetical protein [Deltaproteobacteria bacterium]
MSVSFLVTVNGLYAGYRGSDCQGWRKNNFTELALGFRLGSVYPEEQKAQ